MDANDQITVLLIEDHPGDARLIQELLADVPHRPFELVCVDRLASSLDRLRRDPVDLILLDLSLPDSQGLDTLVSVLGQAPGLPVIVLTGLDDEALAVKAVQEGAQDYLVKGQFNGHLLVRAMRYAIERKRAEEALRIASDRFALAAAAVNSVIYDWDIVRDTITWSVGLQELFGYDPTTIEPSAQWWLAHIHPDDRARVHDQLFDDVARGRDFVGEYRFQHASGTYLDVWDRGRIQRDRQGRALRMVGTLADITDRKRAEYLKDEFVSTVSHELRTPLATIKEFTGILADRIAGPLTPKQQEYLGIIKANVERLARIIDDLLDMAKIEAGRVVLNKALVAVGPLLTQVLQSMRPLADGKQLALTVQVPSDVQGIFADADKVTQVLVNLVSNAIKFTDGPGRVTLRVTENTNELRFDVEDTGVGIPSEELPKLFERFQQLRRSAGVSGAGGTGLGLAICKRLVELHGGRIWVTSTPGQGSVFSFTMPTYHVEEVFREYLKTAVEEAKRRQGHVSVVVFTIATAQELKAHYGLEVVGRLLQAVEEAVRELVRRRTGDVVIRWQGGETVLVLAEVDPAGARAIGSRVKRTLEERTFAVGTTTLHAPILVATATYPDDALSEELLLQCLERQLHRAAQPKTRRPKTSPQGGT